MSEFPFAKDVRGIFCCPWSRKQKQKFMKGKFRAAVMLAAIAMVSCYPASAARETLTVEQVLMQANADRSRLGLPALKLDHTLNLAAFAKAEDMLTNKYFAHVSPEGVKPWHWFKAMGYTYSHAGENLAIGFDDSSDLERSWMESPKHRANILSSDYSDMGVAIVYKNGQQMVVQLFGSRLDLIAIRQ
jgi:uncharacterized protein YkwD